MGDYILGYDPGRPVEPLPLMKTRTSGMLSTLNYAQMINDIMGIPPEMLRRSVRFPSYLEELRFKARANQRACMQARIAELSQHMMRMLQEQARAKLESGELS